MAIVGGKVIAAPAFDMQNYLAFVCTSFSGFCLPRGKVLTFPEAASSIINMAVYDLEDLVNGAHILECLCKFAYPERCVTRSGTSTVYKTAPTPKAVSIKTSMPHHV